MTQPDTNTVYRKKPVTVQAMQLPPVIDIDARMAFDDWIIGFRASEKCRYVGDTIRIQTLEGEMTGNVGDYIIVGVKGEIYPCKPDIFEATYDKV